MTTNFVRINFHDFTRFLIGVPSSPYELRYKRSLSSCMRIIILRSAIINILILCPLINKLNKVDLYLMYLCVFWCEFIDLVVFLAL